MSTKRTRKREFLGEMNRVVPWADLVMLIAPYAPEGKRGRPPFAVEAMLRILRNMLDRASGNHSKSALHGYGQNEFVPWQAGAIT